MDYEQLVANARSPSATAADAAALAREALRLRREAAATGPVRAIAERRRDATCWHWAGLLHRATDDRAAAIAAFGAAATLAPGSASAANARARATMEAGLPAVALYHAALRLKPGDSDMLIGLGAAELAEGRADTAIERLDATLERAPDWIAGHQQLAHLRWVTGEADHYADSFHRALKAVPGNAALWHATCSLLLQAEDWQPLETTIRRAREVLGEQPFLDLFEGILCSETAQLDRADALFEALAPQLMDVNFAVRRVRQLLRRGRVAEAKALVEPWLGRAEGREMWPYAAIVWRMTGDDRLGWLDHQPGLVREIDLRPHLPPLDRLAMVLRDLHLARRQPIDQSVRGGSQTDGVLLARIEPEIVALRAAIAGAVSDHVAALPPRDADHPTLAARRDAPVRFAGSWSVRLSASGRHANHVHPTGWISSALYVALPPSIGDVGGEEGFLTLGQPEDALGLDLAPYRTIRPKEGYLVLFPSTMWHGTIPFDAGERLTVAFDVAHPGA